MLNQEKDFNLLFKKVPTDILEIKPYVPGKPIEEVERELGIPRAVKLASNENPLGPSPEAIAAMQGHQAKLNLYPDGGCYYLKKDLAAHLGVEPDNIIIGNGSDEIVSIITRVFVHRDDETITGAPSFLMYQIDTCLSQGKVVAVPLKDFRLDVRAMIDAITPKTNVIFINNPNNPTGTIIRKNDMQRIVDEVPPDILIVCDEAYCEYVDDPGFPDTLAQVAEGKNVIVLRTFSKIYGLAGLRVGYGVARKEIVTLLDRARPPFNVNSLAQVAARASLRDDEHVAKSKNLVREGKQFLYKKLEELRVSFVCTEANFILIEVGEKVKHVLRTLLKKGIITRDMGAYNLPSYIRLTIGSQGENELFIREFQKALQQEY